MTFTVESKSQLAKLMATENLTVQHQKIQTAKFDPVNRVLYLPIWQNMSGVMYDLLGGHEVGHALYTPAEGWHDAVADKTKGRNYKSFLNVIEDARIEKKVQRKYPGLRLSFRDAYAELNKRDFFGIKNREVNTMAFIERLNLYTKSQYTAKIDFSPEEYEFVKKVQLLETWSDVVSLADEIYAYSKDEQFDMQLQDFQQFDSDPYGDDYDGDGDYELEDYDESDEPQESDSDSNGNDSDDEKETDEESSEQKDGSGKGDDGEESDDDVDNDIKSEVNRFKDSQTSNKDQFEPTCQTDDNFRNNESMLLDEKCKEYVYVTLPKPNYKQIITPAKRVQQLLSMYYDNRIAECIISESEVKSAVSDFKTKNDRYVSLLAKEFEMRKAAKAFSKSKISDTGDIDINKLCNYKFDDNIFRKVMMVPKGKSHGLILLLDRSGSMSENMAGSIEQILVLSMFCRKVNIPFIVYGFGDCSNSHMIDSGLNSEVYHKQLKSCFDVEVGQIFFREVYLREYLNSKMSNAEFSKCIRNMVLLKKSYENGQRWNKFGRPESENLSNTPMIQAVYAVAGVMKEFRKQNNLDLSSLIIVHDGDADSCNYYATKEMRTNWKTNAQEEMLTSRSMDFRGTNVVLSDRQNKYQRMMANNMNVHSSEILSEAIFDWFRATTQSKVFGFFLLSNRSRYMKGAIHNRYITADGKTMEELRKENYYKFTDEMAKLTKQIRSEKFVVSHNPRYNAFYLVAGGDELQTDNEELEIEGKFTSNKLKNAFMKLNKKKVVNRVLVSRFIQGIAA